MQSGIKMSAQKQVYSSSGFTLVELIIAMLLTGVISIGIFSAYKAQQASYAAQDQVTEIQQNIRAGIALMIREVRMAGFDPSFSGQYDVNVASNADSFSFEADINDDGGAPGAGEIFLYELYDSDGDGTNDSLRRTPGGSAIAENIVELEFVYLDSDGNSVSIPLNAVAVESIRSVKLSVLAKANIEDREFSNTKIYCPASAPFFNAADQECHADDIAGPIGTKWGPYNDGFRRRLLITTVQVRNLGLGVL